VSRNIGRRAGLSYEPAAIPHTSRHVIPSGRQSNRISSARQQLAVSGVGLRGVVSLRTYPASLFSARLAALTSLAGSSQATSALVLAKRFKPASRTAESGTMASGV